MLPKTKLGRHMGGKLKVYAGAEHPHGRKNRRPSGRGEVTTKSGIQERFQQVAEMQYYGTGRRKSATARVYLRPGGGNFKVNGAAIDKYFKNEALRMIIRQPLQLTDTVNKFDVVVNVGVAGQAGAVRHGISRALLEFNAELRKKLKKAGLLTRDPRKSARSTVKRARVSASSSRNVNKCGMGLSHRMQSQEKEKDESRHSLAIYSACLRGSDWRHIPNSHFSSLVVL